MKETYIRAQSPPRNSGRLCDDMLVFDVPSTIPIEAKTSKQSLKPLEDCVDG
jgi:hypothetical protein